MLIYGENQLEILSNANTLMMIVIAFSASFVITCILTPPSTIVARKIGAIDYPRDKRRMHDHPIPRFGGMAIMLGTLIAILLTCKDSPKMSIALLGGFMFYLVGAFDDVLQLKAWIKFVLESVIAAVLYFWGIRISFISNYFGPGNYRLGVGLGLIITVLWIVGISNAINLMDGLDGLAAGISAIIAMMLAYVGYIHGDALGERVVSVALMAVAGSSIGFLPYNFSPAKTFMGDSGALFLGYMIAILSVISPLKRATFVAAIVPITALALPILDTLLAIIRRSISGEDIMSPDKKHIHHQIMSRGFGQRRTVLIIYGIVAIMGMSAVMISRELYKDALILALIGLLYLSVIIVETPKPRGKGKNGKR